MKSIEFRGASGGEVTESAYEFTTKSGDKYQVDCGMYQGKNGHGRKSFFESETFDPEAIKAFFVTHAHYDHIGALPLVKSKAPIYATEPTVPLMGISLLNSAAINPELYNEHDVLNVMRRVIPIKYDVSTKIGDNLKVKFKDAGHILGSASLEFTENGGDIVVFSGDIGHDSRTVREVNPPESANILVMESTYGNRCHPSPEIDDPQESLESAINYVSKHDATLVIPAFSIDRTQVILTMLKSMSDLGKLQGMQVFLDSPMASDVTDVYFKNKPFLNERIRKQSRSFLFSELTRTNTTRQSKEIEEKKRTKIIVAGAGNGEAGRVVRHLINYASDPENAIYICGYCPEYTPCGQIANGYKHITLKKEHFSQEQGRTIRTEVPVYVKAKIFQTAALSAHGDQRDLVDYASYIARSPEHSLREMFLVHGANDSREALQDQIYYDLGFYNVHLPKLGEIVEFGTPYKKR